MQSQQFRFRFRRNSTCTLNIFDVTGRLIGTLADGFFDAGPHAISFDASALSSGMYFVRLNAGLKKHNPATCFGKIENCPFAFPLL